MKSDPPPGKIVVGHTLKSTLRLADWSKIRKGFLARGQAGLVINKLSRLLTSVTCVTDIGL